MRLRPFIIHFVFLLKTRDLDLKGLTYLDNVVAKRLKITCTNSADLTGMHARNLSKIGVAHFPLHPSV